MMNDLIFYKINSELRRYAFVHGKQAKYVILSEDIFEFIKTRADEVIFSRGETLKAWVCGCEIVVTLRLGIIAAVGEEYELQEMEKADG